MFAWPNMTVQLRAITPDRVDGRVPLPSSNSSQARTPLA